MGCDLMGSMLETNLVSPKKRPGKYASRYEKVLICSRYQPSNPVGGALSGCYPYR